MGKEIETYEGKVQYYESLIEDLTLENTRLIVKEVKIQDILKEKTELAQILE